ncbi:hypothetical protein TWF718_003039 [Orbilia javanica]|uniref:Uncharacterized protein n=1 Tax=Orbilia javanica TaxID=47235 RepID=A0AAN8RAJ7_9PEZI
MPSLTTLPTELKLEIINALVEKQEDHWEHIFTMRETCTAPALKNFSHCSREFYRLCFKSRFVPDKKIVLGGSAHGNLTGEKIFGEGRLLEGQGGDVKTINLTTSPKPGSGSDTPTELESAFSRLRRGVQSLALFPKTDHLKITYKTPRVLERNTFLVILKHLALIKNYKSIKFYISVTYERTNEKSYEEVFRDLSRENQEFLGERICDDGVYAWVKENIPDLEFPKANWIHVSVNLVDRLQPRVNKSPFEDIKDAKQSEEKAEEERFYHLLFTSAPQMDALGIGTIDEISNSDRRFPPIFHPPPIPSTVVLYTTPSDIVFQHLKRLTIKTDNPKIAYDIKTFVRVFPNLTSLEIIPERGSLCRNGWGFDFTIYQELTRLKHLEDIALPWPRDRLGSRHPEDLSEAFLLLKDDGFFENLDSVDFHGERYFENGALSDISIDMDFLKKDGQWKYAANGHTEDYQWQDIDCSFDSDDEGGESQNAAS